VFFFLYIYQSPIMSTASDKAKATASSIFSATKKGFFRTTQKIKVSLGKAEQTIDISYNQEVERFRAHYKAVKKINRDSIKLLECFRDLSVAQSAVAEDFYNLYESKHSLYNASLKTQDTIKFIDNARVQLDEQMRTDWIDPTSKYLGQFKDLKMRIATNDTRRVDMDRYQEDLRDLQKNAVSHKIPVAETKYKLARANYNNLNNELMHDMPALFEDRDKFMDPCLATFVAATSEYYRQAAKTSIECVGIIAHIDRAAVHDHPRVTEPVESSAATHLQTAVSAEDGEASPTGIPRSSSHEAPSSSLSSSSNAGPSHVPRSAPAKAATAQAKALFDFTATDVTELSFGAGDVLTIHSQVGDWWEASNNSGGKGQVPKNYVQLV